MDQDPNSRSRLLQRLAEARAARGMDASATGQSPTQQRSPTWKNAAPAVRSASLSCSSDDEPPAPSRARRVGEQTPTPQSAVPTVADLEGTVDRVENEVRSAHIRMVLAKQRALRSQLTRRASRRRSSDASFTDSADECCEGNGRHGSGRGSPGADGAAIQLQDHASVMTDHSSVGGEDQGPSEITLIGLPPELIDRVLRLLSLDEIQQAAATCSVFARHCRSAVSRCATIDLVWLKLRKKRRLPSGHALLRLARRAAGALRTLRVHNEPWMDPDLTLAVIEACPRIRALDLMYCPVTSAVIGEALRTLDLRELRVGAVHDLESHFFGHVDSENLASLETVSLQHCEMLADESVTTLAESCKRLSGLDLDGVRLLSMVGIRALSDYGHLHNLVSLSLDGEDLDDVAFLTVGEAALQLRTLHVSFCEGLTDVGLAALAPLVHLQDLRLRKGTGFTDKAFVNLFTSPEFGAELRVLDFSECSGLADTGFGSIALRARNLVSITSAWCWELTDVGLGALFCNCAELVKVDVTGVKRLEGGPVLSIPDLLPKLRILSVKEVNKIKDDELHAVLTSMPQLTIIGFYGESLREVDTSDDGWYMAGKIVLDDGLVLDY